MRFAGIEGTKWLDTNGDGLWNANELALEGWTIFLDLNGDGTLGADEPSTVTDSDGNYSFTQLTAGRYTVAEVLQSGWQQTYPGGQQYYTRDDLAVGRFYFNGEGFTTTGTDGDVATAEVTDFVL